ncbi:hypothetical protein CIB84_008108 [Bambusicola thoracicus]|uniref:Uncharacterized protein n=1 Tax=Bambusicola thoracicus TaxID=9083 RepID=A0A2P4SVJ6_BAMTH|nr:hypothetical protein CIB84_008108 [Bambusicola thoracicus]
MLRAPRASPRRAPKPAPPPARLALGSAGSSSGAVGGYARRGPRPVASGLLSVPRGASGLGRALREGRTGRRAAVGNRAPQLAAGKGPAACGRASG